MFRRQRTLQEIEEFWAHFHPPVTFEDSKQLGEVVVIDLDPFNWIPTEGSFNFRRKPADVSALEKLEWQSTGLGENFCVKSWRKLFPDHEGLKWFNPYAAHQHVHRNALALMLEQEAGVITHRPFELGRRYVIESVDDRGREGATSATASLKFRQFGLKETDCGTWSDFYNPANLRFFDFRWDEMIEL